MLKLGVTVFQDNPWEQTMAAAFCRALARRHEVTRLTGYPSGDQYFDLLFVIGIRPLWRYRPDEERLRRHCRLICETGDYSADQRATFADYYGYFKLNGLNLTEKSFRIPRFVREELLYPEKNDEILCIFVDHYHHKKLFLDLVVEQIERCPFPYEVLHQTPEGVVRNPDFRQLLAEIAVGGTPYTEGYRILPFEEIAAFYRRTHVFMPTHVESFGVVPTEVGACGGLTLLPPKVIPTFAMAGVPHIFYDRDNPVDWQAVKARTTPALQAQYRDEVVAAYGFEQFATMLLSYMDAIPTQ